MSRYYEIKIEITGVNESRKEAIQQACSEEWSFDDDDWQCNDGLIPSVLSMEVTGLGFLCGGETENDFAQRISKTIWEANGTFCPITVNAFNLDELPYEHYEMGKDIYQKAMKNPVSPSR